MIHAIKTKAKGERMKRWTSGLARAEWLRQSEMCPHVIDLLCRDIDLLRDEVKRLLVENRRLKGEVAKPTET